MAQSVKLVRGSQYIELNAAPYTVGYDFAPPAINREYNITSGTSANVSGGGEAVSFVNHDRQFSFTVRLLNSTMDAAKMNMRRITKFIEQRTSDPFYLEYRENSSIPVPLWGQFGAPLRYEIVTATVGSISGEYTTVPDGKGFTVTISLEIKPLATGNKQKLMNASGGVFENNYGSSDGSPKSLSVFIETTNKMKNPVFGNATWNTDWTAAANVIATKNTDPTYCLPGLSQSAKLVCNGAATAFVESIAAGNTNKHSFSALIMRPDLGTPTTADAQLYYDGALATTYQDLGNGLWLAYSDNVTGVAAAKDVGTVMTSGHSVYILAYQMEEYAFHTPICWGDLLGCAWNATAHNGTSTRTSASLTMTRDDTIIGLDQGGVAVVWKPFVASTFGANLPLWGLYKADLSVVGLQAYYKESDDKIYLTDGTNTVSSAAQTFAAGDTLYLEFAWGPLGLNIYKSGANVATGATYTPPSVVNSATLLIGRSASSYVESDFCGFDIYPTEMTSAQAAAIYTAQASVVAVGGRPSHVPWLWTKDGDGVVDNCNDATHDNWCVAGGIVGSNECRTIFNIVPSNTPIQIGEFYVSLLPGSVFVNPGLFYTEDAGGTADANASGGATATLSLPDNGTQNWPNPALPELIANEIKGKEFYPFFRFKDAAANTIQLGSDSIWGTGYGGTVTSKTKNVLASATLYTLFRGESNGFLDLPTTWNDIPYQKIANINLYIKRISGGTVNIVYDFSTVLFRPIVKVETGSSASNTNWIIDDGTVYVYFPSNYQGGTVGYNGDILRLLPGKYNSIVCLQGMSTITCNITYTLTFSVQIIPSYTLT